MSLVGVAVARGDALLAGLSLALSGLVGLLLRRQWATQARNQALSRELAAHEQTAERLAAEEARFESMFETSPDPTWIIDGHQFVSCNAAAVSILGYRSKEALSNTHPSRLSPEFQPDGEASFSKAERMMRLAEERGLHRFEWIHTRLDGSNFPAEVTLSRMTMKGRPVIYCVWRDVSQRKAAEAQVAENQQLLHAIVDNAPALVFVFDATGKLILCNQQFEKAVAHRRDDLLGKDRSSFLPAEIAREHLENDLQVLAAGKLFSFEENNLESDGPHVYLTVKSPLYTASGAAWAVVGISTDITERKHSESESRLAATVFGNTADGIIITDAQGTIISVNRAFQQITGYCAEDAIGAKPSLLKSDHQDAVFSDISTIKRSQAELEHLAHFDTLTDLPNRVLFRDRATRAFDQARRHGHRVAVLLLDLDGFKTINDSLGHPVGDRLLQMVAQRLGHCVRVEDTVSRLGGDEFAVVLSNLERGEDAIEVARKILLSAQEPFTVDEHTALVTTSIGIAVFPDDGDNANDLIRNADAAMYEAKAAGRNTYRFYQVEMTRLAQRRLANERGLRRAIQNHEFEVWYQPQIWLDSGNYLGAEALLRWRDPGLDAGRLAINVAGPQLYRGDFVAALRRCLGHYRIAPGTLEIEVTETFMMENPQEIRKILHAVQENRRRSATFYAPKAARRGRVSGSPNPCLRPISLPGWRSSPWRDSRRRPRRLAWQPTPGAPTWSTAAPSRRYPPHP